MAHFATAVSAAMQAGIDLEPFARAFDHTLFKLGGAEISVGSMLKMIFFVTLLYWFAGQTRRWFVERNAHRLHMDVGTREAIGAMLRYLVLILGFAVMLQNAGINLTALGVVAGALGVGVGFGLQNIISNFISGLIILFERPIKIGDRIEIGGLEGTVREIGARRVTIVTHDNVAILVPNQRFITENVVNLVYTQAPIRLRVPFSVAPTDAELVTSVVLGAVKQQEQVLDSPPPSVLLTSLGGNAMSFELAVWVQGFGQTRQQLGSDLNRAIGRALRAHEIRNAA
jgi:small-conductance mechanosensitive channel